ncbi:MAG TPA: SGNH/GDSL hydrolase family protein [Bryobacteraceae bacterium]|nr:SGNH/GDSL hydrolase family protein [Bryobacteraceae bacterium]
MIRFLPLAAAVCLATCASAAGASAPAVVSPMQSIPAEDSRFRYEGRFDRSNPATPVVVWQGSRIAIDFEGSALALRFEWVEGQNYFDVTIDDTTTVFAVNKADHSRLTFPQPLGPGRHRLTIFKRSEAAAGNARFLGIEIALGAHAWVPPAPTYKLKMQFIGDSITVGACNEDGPTDQWEDRSTHNNARSYGALTASAYQADYRNIAVSGMGIVLGYVEPHAGQIWDRVYPVASSPKADLAAWTPDVVFVNYGENDDSFTTTNKLPFPARFTENYIALVQAIRAAHPQAHIVILRGGMYGGANSEPLREAWSTAVRRLKAGDPRVYSYVFTHWSRNHPRVSDDRAMADELTAWLEKQTFMAAYK